MLLTACIASGLAALAVALRWVLVRVDARPQAFPAMAVSVPAVLAVACAIPVVQHAQLQTRLEAAASALAGTTVTVSCETVGQAWLDAHPERGYVQVEPNGVPQRHAVITYDTCRDLAQWIRSDHAAPTDAQVVAVHVLTHEAMHMAGIVDEARAECAALHRDEHTARLLGADPDEARALALRYRLAIYPNLPAEYRTGPCPGLPLGSTSPQVSSWA